MFNTFKETKCREGPLREAVPKKSRQHSEHVPQALITPPPSSLIDDKMKEKRKKHFNPECSEMDKNGCERHPNISRNML